MGDQDSSTPMPGQVEFSAEEEKAMREGNRSSAGARVGNAVGAGAPSLGSSIAGDAVGGSSPIIVRKTKLF